MRQTALRKNTDLSTHAQLHTLNSDNILESHVELHWEKIIMSFGLTAKMYGDLESLRNSSIFNKAF